MEQNTSQQLRPDAHAPTRVPAAPETPVGRPSWRRVLLTPWLGLVRPRSAGACLAGASRPAFVLLVALNLLGYAVVLIGLMLWDETVTVTWSAPALTTVPTTGAAATPAFWGTQETHERTVGQVWRQWRATAIGGWIGPAEVTLTLVVILGTTLLLFLGWFNLPLVHSTGSVWRSYKRSLRAGAGVLCPIAAGTLLCGSVFIITLHAEYRIGRLGFLPGDYSPFVMLASISVGPCLLAFWLRQALGGVAPAEPELAPPPRCEGCGYNLTHLPEQGRCPECGLHIDASLVEQFSRPGSKWSRGKTAATWRSTAWEVLFRPRAFYRALKLRTPAAAEAGFAGWNYVQLPCVALLWTGGLFLIGLLKQGDPSLGSWVWDELLVFVLYVCAMTLFGLFWCWAAHRTLAGLVVSWWLVRNELPDFHWATKVMTYESTFLWAFLFFWGTLSSSFVVFGDDWISELIDLSPWFVPAEPFFYLAGTSALGVLWVGRYRIAYRAIRWSNY